MNTSTGQGNPQSELLGDLVQICFVTRELKRTLDHFLTLGIGPWRIQTMGPATLSETELRGEPHRYSLRTAVAMAGGIVWEVIEPLDGPSIFDEYLSARGEGIHHLGFHCPGRTFAEAIEEFKGRGFHVIQSGRWMKAAGNAFLGTYDALGAYIEIWDRPPGFVPPAPEEIYPAPAVDQGVGSA